MDREILKIRYPDSYPPGARHRSGFEMIVQARVRGGPETGLNMPFRQRGLPIRPSRTASTRGWPGRAYAVAAHHPACLLQFQTEIRPEGRMRLAYLTLFLWVLVTPSRSGTSPGMDNVAERAPENPVVRVERNVRMLTLVVKGDPARNGDSTVKALLSHFFRGAGEEEMNAPVRPRVRWIVRSPSVPRSSWIGKYGLPVSERFADPSRGPAHVTTWTYGLLAETAYAGPYFGAQPAADSLKAFIGRSGFAVVGEWEEEFVRGKGTLYQGHEESYYTLVRYRIHDAKGRGGMPIPTSP